MKKGTDLIWILLALAALYCAAVGIGEKQTKACMDSAAEWAAEVLP